MNRRLVLAVVALHAYAACSEGIRTGPDAAEGAAKDAEESLEGNDAAAPAPDAGGDSADADGAATGPDGHEPARDAAAALDAGTAGGDRSDANGSAEGPDAHEPARDAAAPAVDAGMAPATSPVRYIRDWLSGSAAFNGNGVSYWVEIQAFDAQGANVAKGKTVSANFTPSSSPLSLITDGDTETEAYLGTDAAGTFHVIVDLGAVQEIASVTRWHYYGDGRIFAGTKTEVSGDGLRWAAIFDSAKGSATESPYAETASGKTTVAPFPEPQVEQEYTVLLSSKGGGPTASLAANQAAFAAAIADLNGHGGGKLVMEPGTYDFGNQSSGTMFQAFNLTNIRVVGYGVTLTVNTLDTAAQYDTPVFFQISSPSNASVEGFTFRDSGADISKPSADTGVQCIYVAAWAPSSGFRVRDCTAENVNIFVNFDGTPPYGRLTDTTISGCTVRNAYYALAAFEGFGSSSSSRSTVQMTCEGVRRAVNSPGLSRMSLDITGIGLAGQQASNAFISPHAHEGTPVEDLDIALTLSGDFTRFAQFQASNEGAMIHLWHQGSWDQARDPGIKFRNVKATVRLNNITGAPRLFAFSHISDQYHDETYRVWQDVWLDGTIQGAFSGAPVHVRTESKAAGNSVYVSTSLRPDVSGLPSYFHSYTP